MSLKKEPVFELNTVDEIPLKIPFEWKRILEGITKMRNSQNYRAPIDFIGPHCLIDENANEKDQRFQLLLAFILSSQTKDDKTAVAMSKLHEISCNLLNIHILEAQQLNEKISMVRFHNRKTIHIKQTCKILISRFDGDIPRTIDELKELPGVGEKIAQSILQFAWNECVGILVNKHVHRVSNRLSFANSHSISETKKQLESCLPKNCWTLVSSLFVGFGQTVCKPSNPNCGKCLIHCFCKEAKKSFDDIENIEVTVQI
eukprot:TRINITY_DN2591_c0_g1_i1.p1 TRINITY_DN2591_c0_g1~~TRINITY_DN2591_c0_g1_i1.p1  ORF type:complete len:259 (-),score=60.67 TRINITY_DN2591_c0_g1_i1:49-825(-)